MGKRRIEKFSGRRNKRGDTCALRMRTKGACSIRLSFRCFHDSTRLGFSLKFGGRISIEGSIRHMGSTSIIIFIKKISPGLRNRRVNIRLPKFEKNSHASVRLPTIRQRLVTTLRRTNGGIILIGYSNSPVNLRPRAKEYKTVLRT